MPAGTGDERRGSCSSGSSSVADQRPLWQSVSFQHRLAHPIALSRIQPTLHMRHIMSHGVCVHMCVVCVCVCVCVCDVLSLSEPPFEVVLLPDGWSGCLERELPQAPGSAPYRPY